MNHPASFRCSVHGRIVVRGKYKAAVPERVNSTSGTALVAGTFREAGFLNFCGVLRRWLVVVIRAPFQPSKQAKRVLHVLCSQSPFSDAPKHGQNHEHRSVGSVRKVVGEIQYVER
jgi:hypothetical protein